MKVLRQNKNLLHIMSDIRKVRHKTGSKILYPGSRSWRREQERLEKKNQVKTKVKTT